MAYANVGGFGAVSVGTSGAALTPAFAAGSPRTAGDLLLLFYRKSGTGSTVPVIAGWTSAFSAGSSTLVGVMWKIAAGADAAPTIPLQTGITPTACLAEFSGNNAAPFDVAATGVTTLTSPAVATNTAIDAASGELFVFVCADSRASSAVGGYVATPNNGMTATFVSDTTTSATSHYYFGYGITTGNGAADSVSMVLTASPLAFSLDASSFKVSGAVALDAIVNMSPYQAY